MSGIEQVTFALPSEIVATLQREVEAGDYATTGEIVREAVLEWTHRRDDDERELKALREAIRIGDESGPGIPADDVFAEVYALIEERRVSRG